VPGKPERVLGQLIEAQRAKMLQAQVVMTCVPEVLLYAEGDDAVNYAEAANAAAMLANDAAEALDSVRLKPMLEALLHQPSRRNS
jgi:phage gp16-like protein